MEKSTKFTAIYWKWTKVHIFILGLHSSMLTSFSPFSPWFSFIFFGTGRLLSSSVHPLLETTSYSLCSFKIAYFILIGQLQEAYWRAAVFCVFFFFFKSNILAHRDYTFMCLIPDKVILTTCNFISIWQNIRKMRASQKAVRSARGRAAMAVWSLCETPELHGLNERSKFSVCRNPHTESVTSSFVETRSVVPRRDVTDDMFQRLDKG